MKKTIRQLKRAVNFAREDLQYDNYWDKREDDYGKSDEELLSDKCRIINEQLFGSSDENRKTWKNPYELMDFLIVVGQDYEKNPVRYLESIPETCKHLVAVIDSLMPEPSSSQFPKSLAVHAASHWLSAYLSGRHQIENGMYISNSVVAKNDSLLVAVKNGDVSMVKQLLREGVSPEVKCSNDRTPFDAAVNSNNAEIVRILLEAGVSSREKIYGLSGVENNEIELAETLADFMTPQELTDAFVEKVYKLCSSSEYSSDTTILEVLLQRGADINGGSDTDKTYAPDKGSPLRWALNPNNSDCNTEVIRFLLNNGANPNLITNSCRGDSAFLEAIGNKRVPYDIFKLMIDKGANTNFANKYGITPLMEAVRWNRKQIAKLLISAGADINAVNNAGKRVIDYAWKRQDPTQALRKYLLSLGAKE